MYLSIDPSSGQPLYLQIIEQIKRAISLGVFKRGDPLPTIREMALQLQVNPNTVAKAIRELEREGIVMTKVGKGTFVSEEAALSLQKEQALRAKQLTQQHVKDLKFLGTSFAEAQELLSQEWKTQEVNHDENSDSIVQ